MIDLKLTSIYFHVIKVQVQDGKWGSKWIR